MKEKSKEEKQTNRQLPTSPNELDQKRRSSLSDTPLTSSSSEGMATNDQPSSSGKSKKKQKTPKKSEDESIVSTNNSPTSQIVSPVYSLANSITPTKSIWTTSTLSSRFDNGISVANADVSVVVNNNCSFSSAENNDWMKSLRDCLNEGDADAFFSGIRILCAVMCRKSVMFQNQTKKQLLKHVVENVIKCYYESTNQTTVFMNLCSTRHKKCSEIKHGYCRIMRTLLKILGPCSSNRYLSIACKKSEKTALHWAIETGELCQLRVLLENDVAVGMVDKHGHTALYYALQRKDLEKIKNLLWYGADFSQCPNEKYNEKPLLQAAAFDPDGIYPWFESRTTALQTKYYELLRSLCLNVFEITPHDALSDLHTLRISRGFDVDDRVNAFESPKDWVFRKTTLNIRENYEKPEDNSSMPVVFILPYCYSNLINIDSPAELPWISRVGLFSKSTNGKEKPVRLFPTNPLLQVQHNEILEMHSLLDPTHNGQLYCYQMPFKLHKRPYVMTSHVEPKGMNNEFVRTVLLGIQVFRVTPIQVDLKKTN
ncbi:ANK-REP-REGION domain-containing protein [Aphelenchoides besseyi]|nr:ANK-REP-REGION domain-containing protein [Aphelenchoides besseyi]